MEKIIYDLIFNRKKILNKKGMALVQIEAYQKKKYFSTKVYLKPQQWDAKRKKVKNHPNAESLNQLLYEYITQIERKELSLWRQGQLVTLESLKAALEAIQEDETSFPVFFHKEVINSSLKESTKQNHLTTLELLKSYKKTISFSELTFEFVSLFDQYLKAKGYHLNTIAKYMKHLKRHINVAINKDYMEIQKYAFRKYKIKCVENHHTHLSPDELNKLEKLVLNERYARLEKTKDAFLFCCYAGLRYSDFVSLSPENIVNLHEGTWLIYKSIKTKVEVRLPLYLLFDGKSLDILKKYNDCLLSFFQLRNNSNINKELLILSKLADINKRISFHTARHTNATLLIYTGVNITTVQKLLGHKSVKTTQVYANVMDMTIVRDLERIK